MKGCSDNISICTVYYLVEVFLELINTKFYAVLVQGEIIKLGGSLCRMKMIKKSLKNRNYLPKGTIELSCLILCCLTSITLKEEGG